MYGQEISASRFVELCFEMVVSEIIILLHAHTHTRHTFSNLYLQILSPHHSQFTHDILAALLSRTETDQTLFSAVSVYRLAPSFPVYLLRGGFENLYMILA
jgi:hypothetical protein